MPEKTSHSLYSGGQINDTFSKVNPVVGFAYFISVIIFSMFFTHPLCTAANLFFSAFYYLSINGRKSLRFLLSMLTLFIVMTLINPLYIQLGDTVLFTYFGTRRFTLEALLYGMLSGSMYAGMMCWFASYNLIMTSDKFIYLLGRAIPSVSLLLSMVLRFVPNMNASLRTAAAARKCIGKDAAGKSRKQQLENGAVLISALTGWALENAVMTSDSMKSRGYGLKNRTSFAVYRFELRDKLMLAYILVLAAAVIILSASGALTVVFYPKIIIPKIGLPGIICITAYVSLLALPPGMNTLEVIRWNVLRSRI